MVPVAALRPTMTAPLSPTAAATLQVGKRLAVELTLDSLPNGAPHAHAAGATSVTLATGGGVSIHYRLPVGEWQTPVAPMGPRRISAKNGSVFDCRTPSDNYLLPVIP
ncbi:hypothetical protein Acsp05_24130 [Actinokineospora sp. NBRC 105648]|nr:hypothetical protein Acsp05_24130 [Actinokineospora sp. NBRC 105648]